MFKIKNKEYDSTKHSNKYTIEVDSIDASYSAISNFSLYGKVTLEL